jgi:phosphoenolpyruvate carboxykinase (ATP)
VKEPTTENDIWWGKVNIPMEERSFLINRERAIDYLNTQKRLFVVDGFAGWNSKYRMKSTLSDTPPDLELTFYFIYA